MGESAKIDRTFKNVKPYDRRQQNCTGWHEYTTHEIDLHNRSVSKTINGKKRLKMSTSFEK